MVCIPLKAPHFTCGHKPLLPRGRPTPKSQTVELRMVECLQMMSGNTVNPLNFAAIKFWVFRGFTISLLLKFALFLLYPYAIIRGKYIHEY